MSDSGNASGGGILVSGAVSNLMLAQTVVSGNEARAPAGTAFGGGVSAFNLGASYASISGNTAGTGQSGIGLGGGIYLQHDANIFGSTLDGNSASYGGGIVVIGQGSANIVNSTISTNSVEKSSGALYIGATASRIWNSTIALNSADDSSQLGAVTFIGPPNATFDLRSSIIGNNTSGPAHDEADLYFFIGSGTLSGADNLVMSSNVSPQGVIALTSDPMLGPLQSNGGLTKTHLPKSGSPVIGAGSNAGSPNEQRGPGYPRTTGNKTDIGSVQRDSIFYGGPD